MLPNWLILLVSFAYLALLFAIAYIGDKRASEGHSIADNPHIYTLSIAVYCTAWTFFGSVGRAATTGVGFLPIYLGPTLMAMLWWFILRKIIRISHQHRVTSIADFIASRFGKSAVLGGLVTIIAVVGIMPYISLQLKGVAAAYEVIRVFPGGVVGAQAGVEAAIWSDQALYVAMILALFAILFGTRHLDATERHEGMVVAIAFESLVKLLAFLAVGLFVSFVLFSSPMEIFSRAQADPNLSRLLTMEAVPGGYVSWMTLTLLSMMAIMFLPRQFQVAVVENINEDHVRKAMWLFPLYLFIINLFVLPIALGGLLHPATSGLDPDTFVLTLPLSADNGMLALFVFIGGLSAATGMVIVATITLSTMVSNDLVMPVLLRIRMLRLHERPDLTRLILFIRRGTIIVILFLAYLYFRFIGESYALVTIGLVSFAAAAQFAPAVLIGMYWKGVSRAGALVGLSGGFLVWLYTLMIPAFVRSGWLPEEIITHGPWGLELLRPYQLFGLQGLDSVSHALFWSMLVNVGGLVLVSLWSRQSTLEKIQAALFVDVFHRDKAGVSSYWQGQTSVGELQALMVRFMGADRTERALAECEQELGIKLHREDQAAAGLVAHVERLLAGTLGAASARVMMGSVVQGEALSVEGMLEILDETSQLIEYSHRLEQKSQELEQAHNQLKAANQRLEELDRLKDEFVSTVSHELRTPLTAVRAFSEILADNPEMEEPKRAEFLGIIIRETERLTRLINEVLDLSKLESGIAEWRLETVDLCNIFEDAITSTSQLFKENSVVLEIDESPDPMEVKGDADRLMQLAINLLSNAVKFSNPEHGKVMVRFFSHRGCHRAEVIDNGVGISADEQQRIFERFHQVTDRQDGKPHGTGLGLPICKHITEAHWGHIWVESQTGWGSKFIVELPDAGGEHCDWPQLKER